MIMHSPPANRALIGYKDANDYAFPPFKQSSNWLRMQMIMHSSPANRAFIDLKDVDGYGLPPAT
jgi:hypothetical protein